MAKDTWERLKLIKPRPKICINEVDTKVIDLDDYIAWIYFGKGNSGFLDDFKATSLK